MPWDDGIDWNPGDPLYTDTPDLSPLPEGPPPLINMPIGMGPDVNMPEPIAGGSMDWSSLMKLLNGAGGSSSSSLLRQLGLGTSSGGLDIGSLLGVLALLGGGINTNNSIKDASGQLQQGAQDANKLATDTIGGAQANFKPYIEAGQGAIPQLQGMVGKGLAGKFNSAGTKSNLGGQFSGAMTLAQLMKGR